MCAHLQHASHYGAKGTKLPPSPHGRPFPFSRLNQTLSHDRAFSIRPKPRQGLYLTSRQHIGHGFPAQVGCGDHVLLSARVPGGYSFGCRHGDAFRHPYRFFR